MLAIQKQPKFIQKEVRLPDGSLALVVFELIEVNGKITAKAVCGKILEQQVVSKEEFLCLPVCIERQSIEPVVSPFFSEVDILIKDLSFIISQPARAPSFI